MISKNLVQTSCLQSCQTAISTNSQNFIELFPSVQSSPEMKVLSVLVKISLKAKFLPLPQCATLDENQGCLKQFVNDCRNNESEVPSRKKTMFLGSFTTKVSLRPAIFMEVFSNKNEIYVKSLCPSTITYMISRLLSRLLSRSI